VGRFEGRPAELADLDARRGDIPAHSGRPRFCRRSATYDPSVIALIMTVAALGVVLAGLAAGRYASWFGIVVPVAITVALGIGWESVRSGLWRTTSSTS
jgi:hypothetical protein